MNERCSCSPECDIGFGECHCGCGKNTRIAPQTCTDRGWIKGKPVRFLKGHSGRVIKRHRLGEIDVKNRTANCAHCGLTTIKKNGMDPTTGAQRWKCHGGLADVHRLSEIDEANRTAWCRACRRRVPFNRSGDRYLCRVSARQREGAYRSLNKERIRKTHAKWQRDNRARLREQHRKRRYGLASDEFAALVSAQDGKCAICGEPPSGRHREKELHIDHCHDSGDVRGLLCSACNRGIGLFHDDPEILKKAAAYVSRNHL